MLWRATPVVFIVIARVTFAARLVSVAATERKLGAMTREQTKNVPFQIEPDDPRRLISRSPSDESRARLKDGRDLTWPASRAPRTKRVPDSGQDDEKGGRTERAKEKEKRNRAIRA